MSTSQITPTITLTPKVARIFAKACVDHEVATGMVHDEVRAFYKLVTEKPTTKGVDFPVTSRGYHAFASVAGWAGMVRKNEVDEDKNKVWRDVREALAYCAYVLSKS